MSKDRPPSFATWSRCPGRAGLPQGEPVSPQFGHRYKAPSRARTRLGVPAGPRIRTGGSSRPMSSRQQNVTAAQWSVNGGALGATDLTAPGAGANVFGANVFTIDEQRARLPKHVFKQLQATLEAGTPLDPTLADAVAQAMREWAMEKGATHYTHWFQPLTGPDRREARLLLQPDRRRPRDRRVLGQGADPGRAGRVVVPDRRHPRDVRGPRLHRVGPDVAGVHPRQPQRHVPVHPDGLRVVDGRGAGPQDPAAALDGRAVQERA